MTSITDEYSNKNKRYTRLVVIKGKWNGLFILNYVSLFPSNYVFWWCILLYLLPIYLINNRKQVCSSHIKVSIFTEIYPKRILISRTMQKKTVGCVMRLFVTVNIWKEWTVFIAGTTDLTSIHSTTTLLHKKYIRRTYNVPHPLMRTVLSTSHSGSLVLLLRPSWYTPWNYKQTSRFFPRSRSLFLSL